MTTELAEAIEKVESLRRDIQAKGKLSDEVLTEIHKKFRLECNYHSNRIEGGTLSKAETRSVMIDNITVRGKPLKDLREMRGHDKVMQEILKLGYGEARISETRIKAIHKTIIAGHQEEDEQAIIGVWKTKGNHVINYREEKFNFVAPEDVPKKIHQLLNRLNTGIDRIVRQAPDAPHPLLLAFQFHTEFLTIHPFTDGNGRTARLLSNLILIALGYPPFWVSEGAEKSTYNRYLADIQGYKDETEPFFVFLASLVERSLQLVKEAAEGRSVEELDDWMKKLELLKSELPKDDALRLSLTPETGRDVYDKSIRPCLVLMMERLQQFDVLFLEREMMFTFGNGGVDVENIDHADHALINNSRFQHKDRIGLKYSLRGFKKSEKNPFSIECGVYWQFRTYEYAFHLNNVQESPQYTLKYDQFYSELEIAELVSQCANALLAQLEERLRG
ncbi:MAG: Fic family protein [Chitinophagales bacterium]|nr:Fic family protein [Chitinophagales bacterium]